MQEAIVAVIVAIAAWAVVKRYAPKAARQFCRAWAARTARRLGWLALEKKLVAQAAAAASCADGCGTCGGCGPTPAAPETPSAITPEALKQTIRR